MHFNGTADTSQRTVNYLSEMVIEMACSGTVGYLLAHVVSLNPLHAAVFCAISVPVSRIVDVVMEQVFNRPGATNESRFLGKVVSFVITTAICATVATFIGFPITFKAGLLMGVALIATWIVVQLLTRSLRGLLN